MRNVSGATGQFSTDKTSCVYCAIGNSDKVSLVVWIDQSDRGSSRSIGGDPPFRGEFIMKDGRKLTWNCTSYNGKTGKVDIAGLNYDLEKGGLFLVSTKEGPIKVKQMPIETVGCTINATRDKLDNLAITDPTIKEFVNAAKAQEPQKQ